MGQATSTLEMVKMQNQIQPVPSKEATVNLHESPAPDKFDGTIVDSKVIAGAGKTVTDFHNAAKQDDLRAQKQSPTRKEVSIS